VSSDRSGGPPLQSRQGSTDYGVTAFALRYALGRGSEVAASKLAAGPALEVLFEGRGFLPACEGYGGLQSPWPVFGGMGTTSLVVFHKSGLKILGEPGVVNGGVLVADQDVDVMIHGAGLPSRLVSAEL